MKGRNIMPMFRTMFFHFHLKLGLNKHHLRQGMWNIVDGMFVVDHNQPIFIADSYSQ